MKMLHATAMIRLYILLMLTVHTAPVIIKKNIGEKRLVLPGIKDAEGANRESRLETGDKIIMNKYPNSIDDEFEGCKKRMFELVKLEVLDNELNANKKFSTDWKQSKQKFFLQNKLNSALTEKELTKVALNSYTREGIQGDLNVKMRDGKNTYMTGFGLISLHFLITAGIQDRKVKQCQTTYRRSNNLFDIPGTEVRFGSFASSSRLATLKRFGSKTCFIIKTCHGADISVLSKYENEAEVLIPPYELFKKEPVTDKPPEFGDCEHVYKLSSAGKESNMKCVYANATKSIG